MNLEGSANFEAMCSKCSGQGGINFSNICKTCTGSGQVVMSQGNMHIQQVCQRCGGRGATASDICEGCSGSGGKRYTSEFSYSIPSGFFGGRIGVEGKGAPGLNGGPNGDVIVEVSVRPSSVDINNITKEELEILKKHLS